MHVLIVENKQDMTSGLSNFLASKGHVVDTVGGGFFNRYPALVVEYDAIVLDVSLPEMDGKELCRKIRAGSCAAMPILMILECDSLSDSFACLEAGDDYYPVKEATMNEIESRLRMLFRMSSRSKQKMS